MPFWPNALAVVGIVSCPSLGGSIHCRTIVSPLSGSGIAVKLDFGEYRFGTSKLDRLHLGCSGWGRPADRLDVLFPVADRFLRLDTPWSVGDGAAEAPTSCR